MIGDPARQHCPIPLYRRNRHQRMVNTTQPQRYGEHDFELILAREFSEGKI